MSFIQKICAASVGALLLVGPVAGASDTEAPRLEDLDFTPRAIDTTEGAQTVDVTFRVTDDVSGYTNGYVGFESPGGDSVLGYLRSGDLVEGDALDGVYSATLTFDRFIEPGTWTIRESSGAGVWISDEVGNSRSYRAADVAELGLPTELEVTSIQDESAPTLADLSFSPSIIDVTDEPVDVAFTIRVQEDLSGFDRGSVLFEPPEGNETIKASFDAGDRVEGDGLDGVYEAVATFPRFIEPGTWSIRERNGSGVVLYDEVGNVRTYRGDAIRALELPTEIEVTSVHDTEGPELVDVTFSPAQIDTETGAQTVEFEIVATDDASGVEKAYLGFEAPVGTTSRLGYAYTPIEGEPTDGLWAGTIDFPQHDARGEWHMREDTGSALCLFDEASNTRCYRESDLIELGFETVLRNGDCCFVDGGCIERDADHPTDPCLACDPDRDAGGWSVTEGASCAVDDGLACTADTGTCDSGGACALPVVEGCLIEDACWEDGALQPGVPCTECDPSSDATAWSDVPQGTVCGDPSCEDGVATDAARCDGSGTCEAPEPYACGTYAGCEGDACPTSCDGDEACIEDAACLDAACVALQADGAPCTADDQCLSGSCADHVCCDSACDGLCEACTESATGEPDGTCALVLAGGDPRMDCATDDPATCGQDGTCDGAGGCRVYGAETSCAPAACGPDGWSSGGWCDGQGLCDVVAAEGCGAYACEEDGCLESCDAEGQCAEGFHCEESACVEQDAVDTAMPVDTDSTTDTAGVHDTAPAVPGGGGGCGCATGPGGGAGPLIVLGLVLLGRRRRPPFGPDRAHEGPSPGVSSQPRRPRPG